MRILLESYGCTLNKGEAEELATMLTKGGHEITHLADALSPGIADMSIIFTCGVINTTELRMLRRIGQLKEISRGIAVCGCLGAICESEILNIAPDAMIFPAASNDDIVKAVIAIANDGTGNVEQISKADQVSNANDISIEPMDNRIGILPIATGCLGECTYCITRFARGQLKSRGLEELKTRALDLISTDIRELQITSQDTAVYGMDMGLQGPRLPDVMNMVSSIDGDFMARVGMMNPAAVLKILQPLVKAYGEDKIFKFIHLPLQSGNDEVLEHMNRHYSTSDYIEITNALRVAHPDIFISTDIITGFPGEKEDQFQDSMDIISSLAPDIVNVTRFSARSGTKAAMMPDQVPGWISKERSSIMMELRFNISKAKMASRIGEKIDVLATEYKKPGTTFLRSRNYRPVIVEKHLPLGIWYEVEIVENTDIHMIGKPL